MNETLCRELSLTRTTSLIREIDLHMHTTFSDGRGAVDEITAAVEKKGLKIVAITDHYSELLPLPMRMGKGQLKGYLEELERTPFLKGVEAEILGDGTVSISRKTADLLNIVLGGLHILHDIVFWHDSRPILNPKKFVEDMRVVLIRSMESGLVDIVAHVTWLPEAIRAESDRLITDDWIKSVVESAGDRGVAIELSGAWNVPNERFVTECLHQGVKLSIGSDAHEVKQVGEVSYALEILKRLAIPNDLVFIPKRGFEVI